MVGRKVLLVGLTILTVIFGILLWIPAFLFSGALLMSDGPPIFSIQRFGPAAIGYTILGAVSSFIYNLVFPKSSWKLPGIWVNIPAFIAVVLFSRDFGFGLARCNVIFLYCGIPLTFACLASYGVMRLALLIRARFQQQN